MGVSQSTFVFQIFFSPWSVPLSWGCAALRPSVAAEVRSMQKYKPYLANANIAGAENMVIHLTLCCMMAQI